MDPMHKTSLALVATVLLFAGTLAGCGSDSGQAAGCTPGETQECVCAGGEEGAQVCKSDGSGFTACDCSASDTGVPDDGADAGDTSGPTGDTTESDSTDQTDTTPSECDVTNGCGGCGSLRGEPGTSCGTCNGTWKCDGDNRVVCDGGAPNPCGGCSSLSNTPGDSCGSNKLYVCTGKNSLDCKSNANNACGGKGNLNEQPGVSCGPCGGGTYVCGAPNLVVCKGGGSKNGCGGCDPLAGRPGSACGNGGQWVCAGDNSVQCNETSQSTNACGGTSALTKSPGRSCGPCNEGTWICDGTDALTCFDSTDLKTDPDHCGKCEKSCNLSNAYASCKSGGCKLRACKAGWGDCDQNFSNGCEQKLNTDKHCGMCGLACSLPHATATCKNRSCTIDSCDKGWADCDGKASNGCETDLNTKMNCGKCGKTCTFTYANASCSNQTCKLTSCKSGYGNCDQMKSNGCEQGLNSVNHCGSCGRACSLANATPSCQNGACKIQSCNSGFENCDGVAKNGCEIDTRSNVLNCGSCGKACATGETCKNSSCEDVATVAASHRSTCTTRTKGKAKCWGRNKDGQLGRGTTSDAEATPKSVSSKTKFVDIETNSDDYTYTYCGLGPSGSVECWGEGGSGELGHGLSSGSVSPVTSISSNAASIALGEDHTCAALSGGGVRCWGRNHKGQLGDGSTSGSNTPVTVKNASNAVDVGASRSSSCLVNGSGTVKCWGRINGSKTPAVMSNLKSMEFVDGSAGHFCGITSQRSVQCWDSNGTTSINVSDAIRIDVGGHANEFGCVVHSDGTVSCWMLESGPGCTECNAELGNGKSGVSSLDTPVQVSGISSAADVSAGRSHACITEKDGTVTCWGTNGYFRLGLEQLKGEMGSHSPQELPHFTPVGTELGRCTDGMDNDGDGSTDCADSDCTTDLGSQTGNAVTFGDLNTNLNYRKGSCSGEDGPEHVYKWTASTAGTYTFEAKRQSSHRFCEPHVYLLKDCSGTNEVGCNKSLPASVSHNFAKNETVYVVVDNDEGHLGFTCPYNLNIQ